jgi:hypothetical protein
MRKYPAISKRLQDELTGRRPALDSKRRRLVLFGCNEVTSRERAYETLGRAAWGHVYERVVGQAYQDLGYKVDQRGLRCGYEDGGIDIVATHKKTGHRVFVQCKAYRQRADKAVLQKLLANGRTMIRDQGRGRKPFLVWASPDIARAVSDEDQAFFLGRTGSRQGMRLAFHEVPWPRLCCCGAKQKVLPGTRRRWSSLAERDRHKEIAPPCPCAKRKQTTSEEGTSS